jgi:uncharacterized membrane protein YfcA
MSELLVILPLVAVCAVIQSMFGVGLLVFGTPALLLLGQSFPSTLAFLLPASLSISLLQVGEGRRHCAVPRSFFLGALPPLGLGLALVLTGTFRSDMLLLVGTMLILTALVRGSARVRAGLRRIFERHLPWCWVLTGFIHGVSNLGGGPLTILLSTLHSGRDAIRANIALCYLIFSLVQLSLLVGLKADVFSPGHFTTPVIALAAYALVGQRVNRAVSEGAYQVALTAFTLTFGLALFARKLI